MPIEALHAPWRIEYILGPKHPDGDGASNTNIGQSNEDEANFVIARTQHGYAVLNTNPYNGGHVLKHCV
jgi:ATP adenylyltransferase